jgi:hypothetical protein
MAVRAKGPLARRIAKGGCSVRDTVLGFLAPVRRRRQWQVALRALSLGVALGALACAALILAHRVLGRAPGPRAAWAALLAGPLVSGLFGLARRPSWQSTAALVDDRCRLHDRTTAALEFSAKATASDFEQLQVRDAVRQLATIRPADVAPLRLPREWPVAFGLLAVAVGLLVWPLISTPARAVSPVPFEPALAEARQLEEQARQMEAAAKELQSAALKAIAERMRRTIEELKQPGLDMRETMAKLSELQAFIALAQNAYDPAPADRELLSLGDAMVEARPLQPAGRALQEQELERAARALEQARSASFDPREARAVAERLKQSAESMKTKGLDQLSRATAGLADGVKGNPESLKQGTQDLAKEIREHDRRRRINELMAREQRRLSDCKNRCEARNLIAQTMLEEQQKKDGHDARSGSEKKSDVPDGSRDDPNGPGSNREKITGQAGDGAAETQENGHSPQGERARARGPSRKVHQKYQRESEAVLDREPIPLGHRESIRRYFELIRPAAGDSEPQAPASSGVREP